MISERIRIGEQYYLLGSALAPRQRRVVLNHGNSFGVFDVAGDIPLAAHESYGLFHRGTRFLHRFELRLNGDLPVLLNSAPSDDGSELLTHLTNADESTAGEVVVARDTLALHRSKALGEASLHEHLQLHNYGLAPLAVELVYLFGADFADVFELRGVERQRRGECSDPVTNQAEVRLSYRGLDAVERTTALRFCPPPQHLDGNAAHLRLQLHPGEEVTWEVHIACALNNQAPPTHSFTAALAAVRNERQHWRKELPVCRSSNDGFNQWLARSSHDLAMLRAHTPEGTYTYAGIPWFATVFGRDGLITALETLAFAPGIAADTLRVLAALQGKEVNAQRDEEPGKIVHEVRSGEMAALGEVPFARYYGSVDATPLFVLTLAAYANRTGDLELVREMWPAATAAMEWITTFGDCDGDGYVEYARRTPRGLVNQGWKDSHDAISHADGALAEQPIALAEVQGYVYAAYCGAAELATRLQQPALAEKWRTKAALLRDRFNRDFWLPEEEIFALALDGHKQPCRVVSSNAGQCLFTGVADVDKAQRVIARLMRDDVFCGWGLRTLAARERRYNPMSYHNGSVWPHDNALVAAGFARHGANAAAAQLMGALCDAAVSIEDHRLPELFCGFARRTQHSPVPYPVACNPQAWSAASVYLLLQSMLGLTLDAWNRQVILHGSTLPSWLEYLEIGGLRLHDARVDLVISRGRNGARVEVTDKTGAVDVVVRH